MEKLRVRDKVALIVVPLTLVSYAVNDGISRPIDALVGVLVNVAAVYVIAWIVDVIRNR